MTKENISSPGARRLTAVNGPLKAEPSNMTTSLEISEGGGDRNGYSTTHDSAALYNSGVLNGGTGLGGTIPHSGSKKEDKSSADMKHSLAKEHNSDKVSQSLTPVAGGHSVTHKASRTHSDYDRVSASRSAAKETTRLVVREHQPYSVFDRVDISIGICLVIAGSFLIATGVGIVAAGMAGIGVAVTAGVSAATVGHAVGSAAVGSVVGAAAGTGIALGVDAVTVDAVGVDNGIDAANSTAITR